MSHVNYIPIPLSIKPNLTHLPHLLPSPPHLFLALHPINTTKLFSFLTFPINTQPFYHLLSYQSYMYFATKGTRTSIHLKLSSTLQTCPLVSTIPIATISPLDSLEPSTHSCKTHNNEKEKEKQILHPILLNSYINIPKIVMHTTNTCYIQPLTSVHVYSFTAHPTVQE